jgi:hypothetical protein
VTDVDGAALAGTAPVDAVELLVTALAKGSPDSTGGGGVRRSQ